MPKETTIGVSKDTSKLLKDYQEEFQFKSLDEAVSNSVRWGRAFAYIDSQQRRSTQQRLNNLEAQFKNLSKLVAFLLTFLYKNQNEKGEMKENVK